MKKLICWSACISFAILHALSGDIPSASAFTAASFVIIAIPGKEKK